MIRVWMWVASETENFFVNGCYVIVRDSKWVLLFQFEVYDTLYAACWCQVKEIHGIATKGHYSQPIWVTGYTVYTSEDGTYYTALLNKNTGKPRVSMVNVCIRLRKGWPQSRWHWAELMVGRNSTDKCWFGVDVEFQLVRDNVKVWACMGFNWYYIFWVLELSFEKWLYYYIKTHFCKSVLRYRAETGLIFNDESVDMNTTCVSKIHNSSGNNFTTHITLNDRGNITKEQRNTTAWLVWKCVGLLKRVTWGTSNNPWRNSFVKRRHHSG